MIFLKATSRVFLAIGLVLGLFVAGLVFIATMNEPEAPEARQLDYLPYTLEETASKQELLTGLKELNVPFPELWLKVAVAETGHCFDDGVGGIDNLFAMRCHDRPWQTGCTSHGYAVYPNINASLYDIRHWSLIDPPKPGEKGVAWLKRRGFNPFPTYWVYLDQVDPEFGTKCPRQVAVKNNDG